MNVRTAIYPKVMSAKNMPRNKYPQRSQRQGCQTHELTNIRTTPMVLMDVLIEHERSTFRLLTRGRDS